MAKRRAKRVQVYLKLSKLMKGGKRRACVIVKAGGKTTTKCFTPANVRKLLGK